MCLISLSNFLQMLLVFLSSIIWVGIKISYLHTYPSSGWRCVKAKITNVSIVSMWRLKFSLNYFRFIHVSLLNYVWRRRLMTLVELENNGRGIILIFHNTVVLLNVLNSNLRILCYWVIEINVHIKSNNILYL